MDFWFGFWIAILINSVVCGGLSAKLAEVKGHDKVAWAWCGFLFGLFGLLAAVGLPDHSNIQVDREGLGKGRHDEIDEGGNAAGSEPPGLYSERVEQTANIIAFIFIIMTVVSVLYAAFP